MPHCISRRTALKGLGTAIALPSLESLASAAPTAGAVAGPPRRLAFVVPCTPENFAAFCRLAWVFVRADLGTLVVEELADVTSPGKAPTYWGEIIRKGLRFGPDVYALTQRPSESDKTVMGNASVLHVHQMAREEDCRYMARELRVAPELIDGLIPFHWIERDRRTRELTHGAVTRKKARR